MFKDKLIELRKLNNDTQDSLANKLYVSRSLISKWERGISFPLLDDLNKICSLYNVEFEYLLSKNELKNQYGIVSRKNKINKNVIFGLILYCLLAFVFFVVLIFNMEISSNNYTQNVLIKEINVENDDVMPLNTKVDILLENDTLIEDVSINEDGYSNIDGCYITFGGIKYTNVMLNNITKGNYITYQVKEKINIFNIVYKKQFDIIQIDFDYPDMNSEVYVQGVYISLNPDSNEFDPDYCFFVDYLNYNDALLVEGNFVSFSRHSGLVCKDSNLEYTLIKCVFYLDKWKLNSYINQEGIRARFVNLVYVYSNGETSMYPLNSFTLNKEVKEYAVDPWTTSYNTDIPLSYYFFQSNIGLVDGYKNVLIELEIVDKQTPNYYEIIEFDENDEYIRKQRIYSYADLNNYECSRKCEKMQVIEISNDNILNSYYAYKKEDITLYFSNEYGIFN